MTYTRIVASPDYAKLRKADTSADDPTRNGDFEDPFEDLYTDGH